MPFKKSRSIEEMDDDKQDFWCEKLDADCIRRMDQLWRRSARLADRRFPRGLFKFRNLEEMEAHREAMEQENIERLRRERPLRIVQRGRFG